MTDARPSPTLALLRRARRAELALAAAFDPHGLTIRKHDVLRAIHATPGLSHGELARRVGVDVHGVGTLVRALVEADLVRERVPAGGHAPSLTATEKGGRVLGAIDARLRELDAELFPGADGDELAAALLADTTPASAPPQD
ncbi:MAG: winged helix-turn-helix transcriptional regulator [Micrococcales bacterium]|nr:winged helix-turn-helix transcriptional regulator [Micrococcales bacterium]